MDWEVKHRKVPRDQPGAGFHRQSGNIGLGVILRGEVKRVSRATVGKPSAPQAVREPGLKGPLVTRVRPEAARSWPGQGEAGRKPRGGLKFK